MEQNKYVDKLLKLTKGATSQFHTVLETKKQLEEAGFEEVALRENWDLKRGGKYFMVHHDSTIFAFTIGEEFEGEDGFRLAACHGDFPGFRIKPNPEIVTEGYVLTEHRGIWWSELSKLAGPSSLYRGKSGIALRGCFPSGSPFD